MNDDAIREALKVLEPTAEPPAGMADVLFARLVAEIEGPRAPSSRQGLVRRAPRLMPRRRWILAPAAVALAAISAAIITIVPQPRSAFAVLEQARERFTKRPFHATVRNVFSEFVGNDTLVVELWFKSATQWRSTVKSSSNPSTPEEAGDFIVFDGTSEGRYEVEENAFYFRPEAEVEDPYVASGANERDPTGGYWPSATGLKPTPQFLDENCRVSEDRVAGRAADMLTCDTGGEPLGTVGIWLDRETGFILKISTPEVLREVLRIDYDPAFPADIFDVVAPGGATLRGDVPGRPSGGEANATIHVGEHVTSVQAGLGSVWAVAFPDTTPCERGQPCADPPSTLHRIDPTRNAVVATIPVDVGAHIAVGEGAVWIAGGRGNDGTLSRLDPATNEFTGSPIALGTHELAGIGVGEGAVWVTARTRSDPPERGELMRIDPSTGEITRIALEGWPSEPPVFGAGSAWVHTQAFNSRDPNGPPINRVYRVNARTRAIENTIRPARTPALAFGDGALWMLSADERSSTLTRIDPATNRAVATVDLPPGANRIAGGFAVGGGYVWVLNADDGTLTKVDVNTNRVAGAPIRVGRGAQAAAVGEGAVWVGNYTTGTVLRIDIT